MLTGIVLVVFGFSGFESSTALGEEAKDPLRTIPRSLIQSTVICGFFFIFVAYVVILAFENTGLDLGNTEAPLDVVSKRAGVGYLGVLINIGAFLSFFSCTLACINSTARIVFSMARHGLFHDALGEAHEVNETPHIAVGLSAVLTFVVPAFLVWFGVKAFDAQGYLGTLCSLGFIIVYILVSVAAPVYLRNMGKLHALDVVYSALGVGFMILPLLGTNRHTRSKLFPPPAYPNNLLNWLFAGYMVVGLIWLLIQRARTPRLNHSIKSSIDEIHLKFGDIKHAAVSKPK